MNSIVNYIVESSLCLGVFTLFYYGYLRRQNLPGFSRWYLLISLVLPQPSLCYTLPLRPEALKKRPSTMGLCLT